MLKANGAAQTSSSGFNGYYVLGNEIDLDGVNFAKYNSDATATNAVIPTTVLTWGSGFEGTFDGRGYKIKNFTISWDGRFSLFGHKHFLPIGHFCNAVFTLQSDTSDNKWF